MFIRFWCQLASILVPKINQNPIKKRSKTSFNFWSSFGPTFFKIWLNFEPFLVLILVSKSVKTERPWKREAVFDNDCAPNPPTSTPRHSKYPPKDPLGLKNSSQWHPSEPEKHQFGPKTHRTAQLPHNCTAHAPEESLGSQNKQKSTPSYRITLNKQKMNRIPEKKLS